MNRLVPSLSALLACLVALAPAAIAQQKPSPTLPESYVKQFDWRCVGPANMGGRITSVAVYEKDPCIWWAATASGGLLKTVNNGITFTHQFDRQATVSIGDVQVAQSDPNIVWVGTGEANPRNSSSWGDGVYKSLDGGKTWKNMGLKQIFQTGRIAIHPTDPDVVYVGALGRLWGESKHRGLFKTTDGGKKWKQILFVDEKTGVVDVQMDPKDPNRLYVATYERRRDGFDGNDPQKKYGEGAGIYRTDDGGENFTKLSNGLPTCKLGRIGLTVYRKDPKIVYAIVESEKIGQMPTDLPYAGLSGANAEVGAKITTVTKDGPADKAGLKKDDIVVSVNGKLIYKYDDLLKAIRNGKVDGKLKLTCSRNRESTDVVITLGERPRRRGGQQGGGRGQQGGQRGGGRNEFTGTLGGQSANRQDFQGPDGHEYGGVYMSKDRGQTWKRINSLNPRPMYYSQIRVDPNDNKYVYVCGTRLYRSKDGGTTFTNDGHGNDVHVDHHALWIDPRDGRHMILGNDGGMYVTYDRMDNWDHHNHVAIGQFYHVGISFDRDYSIYGGLQDNGSWGGPSRARAGRGPLNTDWLRVGGGDGFICLVDPNDPNQIYFESQNGALGRIHLTTGERGFFKPRGGQYRFNWKTPFILSPHNPKIHYSAGNHVFRSVFKGNRVKAISPDITNTKQGAGSAISESAVEEGVLYVGTTDGALWASTDGGANWVNLFTEPAKVSIPKGRSARGGNAGGRGPGGRGPGGRGPGGRGPGGRGPGGLVQFLQRLLQNDANKDGILQADEIPERARGFVRRFDTNGDGQLDKKELAALGGRPPQDDAEKKKDDQKKDDKDDPKQDKDDPKDDKDDPKKDDKVDPKTDDKDDPKKDEKVDPKTDDKDDPKKDDPEKEADDKSASDQETAKDDASAKADPVTGKWVGEFVNANFTGGFSLTLARAADGTISGNYSSPRAEGRVVRGELKGDKLTVVARTGSELTFTGTLQGDSYTGTLTVANSQLELEFTLKRDAAAAAAIPGKPITELVPGPRWVSSLEASRHEAGRCYMTLDGHRSDDDEPYVFVTEDYGRTWRSLLANLPKAAGTTRVIREDVINQNVLYLGCEFSCWVSIDRGESWTKLNNGDLPTVAIHEFAIHPTAGEVVVATHGRSLWVGEVGTLRQLSKQSLAADATLYTPQPVIRWRSRQSRGSSGTRAYIGENPSSIAKVYYSLGKNARSVNLQIATLTGEVLVNVDGTRASGDGDGSPAIAGGLAKGLHKYEWNLSPQRRGQGGRGGFRRSIPVGKYRVTLTVDGSTFNKVLTVENDPKLPPPETTEEEYEFLKALYGVNEEEGDDGEIQPRDD